jgi:hypothetical protein
MKSRRILQETRRGLFSNWIFSDLPFDHKLRSTGHSVFSMTHDGSSVFAPIFDDLACSNKNEGSILFTRSILLLSKFAVF